MSETNRNGHPGASIISALRAADQLDAVLAQAIYCLDEQCRAALNISEEEVFGSIARLWAEFPSILEKGTNNAAAIAPALCDESVRKDLFEQVLESLERDGDIIFATDRQRARSRTFEVVHYLRKLRQRTLARERSGMRPSLFESIKVEVRPRDRPIRSESPESVCRPLDGLGDELAARDLLRGRDQQFANELGEKIFVPFLKRFFSKGLSRFQAYAATQLLRAGLALEPNRPYVVAAGTGFGKTEAFLLPALMYACLEANGRTAAGGKHGPEALLLYPRVDLCNNQLERVLKYVVGLNEIRKAYYASAGVEYAGDLRVSVSHGRVDETFRVRCPLCEREEEADREKNRTWSEDERALSCIVTRNGERGFAEGFECRRRPGEHRVATDAMIAGTYSSSDGYSDVAIATVDTLHRRLMDHHGTAKLFPRGQSGIRFLVVDEMHIYEGQSGAHAAQILRRARRRISDAANGHEPVCVGASATVSSPELLARRLFGVPNADVVQPSPKEKQPFGIEYFVFARTPGNRVVEPGLQRVAREDSGFESEDSGDLGQAAGQNNQQGSVFVSERAAMIQAAFALQHGMKTGRSTGDKRRTLGFVDSVDGATRLGMQLGNAEWQDLDPGTAVPAVVKKPPLYALRTPVGRAGVELEASILEGRAYVDGVPSVQTAFSYPPIGEDCPRREHRTCLQPPHHILERCERYESGECWWSMGLGGENLRPAPIQVHSAKTRTWSSSKRVPAAEQDRWRILISTSALEVGFDHNEIIATWQYHAPPSVASFVQRKGRGGRGPRDYPITLMVLGPGQADSHAFHEHLRYVDVDGFDCYLDHENPSVRKQHVFASVLDCCAAAGKNVYKRPEDVPKAIAANRAKFVEWVSGALGVRESDAAVEIDLIADYIRKEWLQSLDASYVPSLKARRTLRPVDLFVHDLRPALEEWRRVIPPTKGITRAWVESALRWMQRPGSEGRTISVLEFCAVVPLSRRVDPDRKVPESTIPVPLGGHIDVLKPDGTLIQSDSAESSDFALRAFLPGGFKIRYGKLLMAPWVHSHRAPGLNLTWAATRRQIRAGTREGQAKTISDLVVGIGDPSLREEVKTAIGSRAVVAYPEAVTVEDFGSPRTRRFLIDDSTLTVLCRRDQAPGGQLTVLTRDPNLTPLVRTFPKMARGSRLCGGMGLIAEANFHPDFRAVRSQYGNIVHCYPDSGDVRSVVVRFFDETVKQPLVLATELRSQAVELSLAKEFARPLSQEQASRAFWIKFAEMLAGGSVLERGILPNSFVVPNLVECAKECELLAYGRVGAFSSEEVGADIWRGALDKASSGPHHRVATEVLRRSTVTNEVLGAFRVARQWLQGRGSLDVAAESVLAAARHMAARAINVSPDSLVPLSSVTPDRTRLFLVDNYDGGSGTARRVSDLLNTWGSDGIAKRIAVEARCPAAEVDEVLHRALSSGQSPDALAAMATERAFPPEWTFGVSAEASQRAIRRLARLVENPALAAFSLFAHERRLEVERKYQGMVPLAFLVRDATCVQALDVRAEWLRRRFLVDRDGLSELEVRLAAVAPLCRSGCPECIGTAHWNESSLADRTYLATLVGGAR